MIRRKLILHPKCSIVFPPAGQSYNPFRKYYEDLVAVLAKQARADGLMDRGQQLKVLNIAAALGI
jgi:hypothetical protein